MINTWYFNIISFLVLNVIYNLVFKKVLRKNVDDGALISLVQIISGVFVLLLSPCFKWQFSSDIKVYVLLFISCIFYALCDRIDTTARSGLEVSMHQIFAQATPIFTFMWGIMFFKEQIIFKKIIGLLLIVLGNIFVLYRKGKFSWNKYVLFSILGNLFLSIAISIDVGISEQFNLPLYIFMTLALPSILIIFVEKIKIKDLIIEYKEGDRSSIIALSIVWGLMMITNLRAYQLGTFSNTTIIEATTSIINVISSYFLLKEKNSILKKFLAAILVTIGVILASI